jgi:hypothetical protein
MSNPLYLGSAKSQWLVANGEVTVTAGMTPVGLLWPLPASTVPDMVGDAIVADGTLSLAMSGNPALGGVADQIDETTNTNGVSCAAGRNNTGALHVVLWNLPTAAANQSQTLTALTPTTFGLTRRPSPYPWVYDCTAENSQLPPGTPAAQQPATPTAGLWAVNTTATFRWVMILQSSATGP